MARAYDRGAINRFLKDKLKIQDSALRRELIRVSRVRSVKKRRFIIRNGEPVADLNFLLWGVVKGISYTYNPDGCVSMLCCERTLPVIDENYRLFETDASGCDVEAITDCDILAIPVAELRRMVPEYPELSQIVVGMYAVSVKFHSEFHQLLAMYSGNLRGLYRYFAENKPLLTANCNLEDLSDFIGVSVYQLSRIRSQLRREEPEFFENMMRHKL